MRQVFLVAVFSLLIASLSYSQSGANRDSVRSLVEQVIRQKQDSLNEAKRLEEIQKGSKPLDTFLQEMREREQAERRRRWVRIGAGVFFFSLLLITSILRYRAGKKR